MSEGLEIKANKHEVAETNVATKELSLRELFDGLQAKANGSVQRVEIPELGGHVYVRQMRVMERDALDAESVDPKSGRTNIRHMRGRLLCRTLADKDGKRLCNDGHSAMFDTMPSAAVERLVEAAMSFNGMRPEEIEELAENFDETPADDSDFV